MSDFRTSDVTNNRMELGGFILGGKFLTTTIPARKESFPEGEPYFKSIEFWSDSQYALGVLFRKNWHPRDNLALVAKGKKEIQKVQDFFGTPVSGHFIRGHKGYFINELADLAAQRAIQKMRSFQHSLAIRAICEECAFCEHFPCEIPGRQARTWKRRFVLIAHGETYCRDTSVCSGRKAYESEFKLLA